MPRPDRRLAAHLAFRRALQQASSSRRKSRKPPEAQPPLGVAVAYQRELKGLVDSLWSTALQILGPHLDELAASSELARDDAAGWLPPVGGYGVQRMDASSKLIGRLINDIVVAHGQRFPDSVVGQMALKFGKRAAEQNRDQVNRQFRAVLGVDLPDASTAVGRHLEDFRVQNVNLITKMQQDQLGRIRDLLERRSRQGARVEDLRRELEEQEGIGKSRAQLIARDQVLKLNGELTQLRHREAGVDRYEWNTSGDERVRHDHAVLDGTIHKWTEPPIVDKRTGRRAHPGEDFQCRCTANPVIDI